MNIPKNFHQELFGLYEEVKATFEQLNALQSALDRKVADQYHTIEKSDFGIEQGHHFACQLKETLQHRRVIKDEMVRLIPVYNMLKAEIGRMDEQYQRAVRKGFEIKQSLNSTLGIEDVLRAIGELN